MTIARFNENYPFLGFCQILPAGTTNPQSASPSQPAPHRWDAIIISSTAAVSHDVRIQAYIGATAYYLGTVQVPAGAGYTNVPTVEALAELLHSPNDGIALPGSAVIRLACAVTLGAGEAIDVTLIGGLL